MTDILIKSIVGGLIIGIVSTLAQKNPTAGAFIMGIPLVSIITLTIMHYSGCLLYTSPSPRDKRQSRMPSSA